MANLPNFLTVLRIGLIPVMVLLYYLPFDGNHVAAAVVFAIAGFTDWLDGYLARSLRQVSQFGTFLDPVADKLIVAVALVLIVAEINLPYISIAAAVIVSREIVVSALREWMAEIGKRASVAVSYVGKIKTSVQMLSLVILLAYNPSKSPLYVGFIGYILLYLAAILTIWTMLMYLKTAWPELRHQ